MTDRRLWSYKDIAAHIKVQPDTVRSYRKHGPLPGEPTGAAFPVSSRAGPRPW